MFCIRIADVVIGIENRYSEVKKQCGRYIVTNQVPAFTVAASEEEILQQLGESKSSPPFCESLCIFRKLSLRLIDYDAFLMHGAVVEVDGKAYAFAAPSGTGKTTHILFWRKMLGKRVRCINGDKPILRFIDGRLFACGNPWRGKEDLGRNMMCPLVGICFLERGTENSICRIDMSEAMDKVFRQLLMPKDPEQMEHFLSLVERMLETVPCYRMQCNMQPEAAAVAYAEMKKGEIC